MTDELGPRAIDFSRTLKYELNPRIEEYDLPLTSPVYSLYNPSGMELRRYLDPEHRPQITNFSTVIISDGFANLRGADPNEGHSDVFGLEGDPAHLLEITLIANSEEGSESRENRERYLGAMKEAMSGLYHQIPLAPNDVLVPVERCGGNIARALGMQGVHIEVKRLRFRGYPDLLGAGLNLDKQTAERLRGKNVRLLEGVVASGSTECAVIAALENLDIEVEGVSCDAVVTTPAGASFVSKFREALGVWGEDNAVYVGGSLSPDWYVVFHKEGMLLEILSPFLKEMGFPSNYLIGEQVLGDSGDYTSNV